MSASSSTQRVQKLLRGRKPRSLPGGTSSTFRKKYLSMKRAMPEKKQSYPTPLDKIRSLKDLRRRLPWLDKWYNQSNWSQRELTRNELLMRPELIRTIRENLVYIAVQRLHDPSEIRAFYRFAVAMAEKKYPGKGAEIVREQIAYYTENNNVDKVKLWKAALGKNYQPIFGHSETELTVPSWVNIYNDGASRGTHHRKMDEHRN